MTSSGIFLIEFRTLKVGGFFGFFLNLFFHCTCSGYE